MPVDATIFTDVTNQVQMDRSATRRRDTAYRAIKDSILNGIFEAKLPLVEEWLAARLNISRTPVREALAILEHEGLIEYVPNKGLFVKAITTDEFMVLQDTAVTIVAMITQQAARCATDKDIAALEVLLAQGEQCGADDIPGCLTARRAFLMRLSQCVNNPYLTTTLMGVTERIDLYLINIRRARTAASLPEATAEEYALLSALRAGAVELAVQAAKNLIRGTSVLSVPNG